MGSPGRRDAEHPHGRPVLAVERYDRRGVGAAVRRIHQEDGCQALGLDSFRDKYQTSDRPPSYRALAGVLVDHSADPVAEWRRLGALMTVTVALGNGDGHARNHSFLIGDGVVRLAPAYDVAPTVDFVTGRMVGLWVNGQAMLYAVTRAHLVREMATWGMPAAEARSLVDGTLAELAGCLPVAAAQVPSIDPGLVERCTGRVDALRMSPPD